MRYVTFNIKAVNKHSRSVKVERPIMFELHDLDEKGFVFRFRDIKLKHCTDSISIKTRTNILDDNGDLNPILVAEFLSKFFKNYYTYVSYFLKNYLNKNNGEELRYGIEEIQNENFIDGKAMLTLMDELNENSISPTVIRGVIDSLDEFISDSSSVEVELGEKIKSVQKNRRVISFKYDYSPAFVESVKVK